MTNDLQNLSLKYLHGTLDAAQALGILADQAQTPRLRGIAIDGLHSALIVAEEVRQAMKERETLDASMRERLDDLVDT